MNITYVIFATPRSGSYLLCEALKNTNLAGYPKEYFGPYQRSILWKELSAFDQGDYVGKLIKTLSTPNNVFGIKITWRQFVHFIKSVSSLSEFSDMKGKEIMDSLFPNLYYIYITRNDKTRQAISYWKALQTGVWTQTSGAIQQQDFQPIFDYGAINVLLSRINEDEKHIQHFFVENNLKPFKVVYEEFITTYEETSLQILDFLKIQHHKPIKFSRHMHAQSNKQSEEWLSLFNSIKNDTV